MFRLGNYIVIPGNARALLIKEFKMLMIMMVPSVPNKETSAGTATAAVGQCWNNWAHNLNK